MKKLLTILLVLISFSTFAQFEAGEYINSDTVKIDGAPLLLNTFKQGNLGGAGNIFYSTGASSQPASGTVNQVVGNNYIQNQNSVAQNANMSISGVISSSGARLYAPNGEYIPLRGFSNLKVNDLWYGSLLVGKSENTYQACQFGWAFNESNPIKSFAHITPYGIIEGEIFKLTATGAATFASTITGTQLISNIATGTPPLVVASSTKVDSLNVGLLDGKKASDFQLKSDTLNFDATLSDLADSSAAIRSLANTKASVSGTDNYIMKKTGANTLGNSLIQDNGTAISIGLPVQNNNKFQIVNNIAAVGASELVSSEIGAQTYNYWNTPTYTGSLLRQYGSGATGKVAGISSKNLGVLTFQNTDTALIYTNGLSPIVTGIYSTPVNILNIDGNSGFGTLTPAARIHSQSTGTQARFGYDANKYTDLSTGSTGNLTIDPTGDTVKVVGAVNSTGGFFKNGVEITGGGGGMVYPPAGLAKSTGTGWTTSITDNSTNWTAGYNYRVIAAGATAPLYLSLSGNVLSGNLSSQLTAIGTLSNSAGLLYNNGAGSFSYKTAPSGTIVGTTDSQSLTNKSVNGVTLSTSAGATNFLAGDGTYKAVSGTSKWTADTYGINYQSGNVGVGTTSSSNAKIKGYTANSGVIGVYGYSVSDVGVYGGSSSSIGVSGYSVDNLAVSGNSTNSYGVYGNSTNSYGGVFSGLGVQATKFYVSSLNTAPASSTATGTTGEIRFTSDYIYVCVATNTWKRTQISTW